MKKYVILLLSVLLFLQSDSGFSYVFSRNKSGQVLSWPKSNSRTIKPIFIANWKNTSGLSYASVFTSITRSLQRWKHVGGSAVDFDYYQASNADTPAAISYDSKNSIFFSSETSSSNSIGRGTLAVTSFFSSGSTLLEADIEFNDRDYVFTNNPKDSTLSGSNKVFLENVATHELGHAFGLSHSAVLQSSMVYLEAPQQAWPSCDDKLAIATLYPSAGFEQGRGSITGSVFAFGSPVFGAHVLAISKTRGTVIAGAITSSSGQFRVENLEPGEYVLMIEPFQATAPIASLCGGVSTDCSFGQVNSHKICNDQRTPFKRQFFEVSPGKPELVIVDPALTTAIPPIDVSHCTSMHQSIEEVNSKENAPVLIENNKGETRSVAISGVISSFSDSVENQHFYRLNKIQGTVTIRALAFGLYSSMDPTITVFDKKGRRLETEEHFDNVFYGQSNYINYDSSVTFTAETPENFLVVIRNKQFLPGNRERYPAGAVPWQIEPSFFYLVLVGINDQTSLVPTSDAPDLPDNPRCESSDNFIPYEDKGPPPTQQKTDSGVFPGSSENPQEPPTESKGCGVLKATSAKRDFTDGLFSFSFFSIIVFLLGFRFGLTRLFANSRFSR